MSSPLHQKINSYAIEKGIEFGSDNSLPRIETGSYPQSDTTDWFSFSTSNSVTSEDGPGGGNYSHKFLCSTNRRYRINYSTNTWYNALNDGDYTIGIWIKINPYTYAAAQGALICGNVAVTSKGGWTLIVVTNAAGFEPLTQLSVGYPTSNTTSGNVILFDGLQSDSYVELDRWHYIVIRRTDNTNMEIYLDGVLKHNLTGIFVPTTNPLGFQFGSPIIAGIAPDRMSYNISNFHLSPSSVIGPTEIAEIWNVGKSISRPVHYFDGNTWQTNDLGGGFNPFLLRRKLKIWNGNTWHEINGQHYDNAWIRL